MLFTSALFSYLYLPIVAAGFFLLGRTPRAAATWLGLASIYFYGYWMPEYVALLLVSIVTNYGFGIIIGRLRDQAGDSSEISARIALIFGLIFNFGLLSWFKYANFLLDMLRTVTTLSLPGIEVILPIGISFFTFTQIAFLVDTFTKGTREYRFTHYLLFVTYFPHLIAGIGVRCLCGSTVNTGTACRTCTGSHWHPVQRQATSFSDICSCTLRDLRRR